LTPELLPTNTYQDVKVEAGKKYYYYLTAVDKTGNVSEASEVVSEIVP
jgi:fibronectin type 3 domain-containing protein